MLHEAMELLSPVAGGLYVDATLGMGGYAEAILELTGGEARVIGMDVDPDSIEAARGRLSRWGEAVEYVAENFARIEDVLAERGIERVDGIVADLGISSYQLECGGRGFSFLRDEPLDMRMDPRLERSAADLVNRSTVEELCRIIKRYGEERWASRIAREIVRRRKEKPIETSLELASLVSRAIPRKFHPRGIHPATRTFQALRIEVNRELDNLRTFMATAPLLLRKGGRIVVVTFHSLEDRVVKRGFKRLASPCTCPPDLPVCVCNKKQVLRVLTPSPLTPGMEECMENRRARSAKLRAAERI